MPVMPKIIERQKPVKNHATPRYSNAIRRLVRTVSPRDLASGHIYAATGEE
jgi:hypothetical protein